MSAITLMSLGIPTNTASPLGSKRCTAGVRSLLAREDEEAATDDKVRIVFAQAITYAMGLYDEARYQNQIEARVIYTEQLVRSLDERLQRVVFPITRNLTREEKARLEATFSGSDPGTQLSYFIRDLQDFRLTADPVTHKWIDETLSLMRRAYRWTIQKGVATDLESSIIKLPIQDGKINLANISEDVRNWLGIFGRTEFNDRLTDTAEEICQAIRSLKPGERIAVPGGINHSDFAHFVVFEVSLNARGIEFTVLDPVANQVRGESTIRLTVYENLSSETFFDLGFWRHLLSLHVIESSEHTSEHLSKILDAHLVGVYRGTKTMSAERYDPQPWGMCTYSAPWFLFRHWPKNLRLTFELFCIEESRALLPGLCAEARKERKYSKALLSLIEQRAKQALVDFSVDFALAHRTWTSYDLASYVPQQEGESDQFLTETEARSDETLPELLKRLRSYTQKNGHNPYQSQIEQLSAIQSERALQAWLAKRLAVIAPLSPPAERLQRSLPAGATGSASGALR